MNRSRLVFPSFLFLAFLPTAGYSQAGLWGPWPVSVHEWGVHEFDWTNPAATATAVAPFMYTDKTPGVPIPPPGPRVKDLPPDWGIRLKPVLYFHTRANDKARVGVEVRFVGGHASSWWPQVSIYRTPAQVAQAAPFDYNGWMQQQPKFYRPGQVKVPDDQRFELAWQDLTITKTAPPRGLPDHTGQPAWIAQARKVDCDYVSNGKETEKFLFYEGQTRETPALAVLPANSAMTTDSRATTCYLVNAGDQPIYDVFVVYRDTKRGVRWSTYLAELPVVPTTNEHESSPGHAVIQIVSIPLPDFATLAPAPEKGDSLQGAERQFTGRLRDRMLETLTAGAPLPMPGNGPFPRIPAAPQPPTQIAMLYADEAAALDRIWAHDFFSGEGLTIVYREAPAYLDQAMPLQLFTDAAHYVVLSRCGLVLNQQMNVTDAPLVEKTIYQFMRETDPALRTQLAAVLSQRRFLALGLLHFYIREGASWPGASARYDPLVEWLEGGAVGTPPAAPPGK